MGQAKSACAAMCAPDRSLIQYFLLPKNAPEWYRKIVMGVASGDIHLQDPPEGSLMLLGHISLAVPDLEREQIYYVDGLSLGESQAEKPGELWVNLGPSQIRLSQSTGDAQKWPGEIRIWVEDIRATTDMFNMLGRTLGTDIIGEMKEAIFGGEFSLKMHDPSYTNWIIVSEAPWGWAPKIRAIESDPSKHELEYPAKTKNALCLSDAVVFLPKREQIEGAARFYDHFLGAQLTKKYSVYDYQARMDTFMVHFGPGDRLHQTLTFKSDKDIQIPGNLASVCIYLISKSRFHLAFAKCKKNGLLTVESAKPFEEVEAECEFSITGIIDPQNGSSILPLKHIFRLARHPECPIHHYSRVVR
mmetsp:Transcript_46327/g.83584  ORF Transcript_46327/g.83584 Transcript_46327/m.83584 type:complete len:359 (+) Transcript_46327:58-1134(+)